MQLEVFSGFVGVVVSLAFAYVPHLRNWFDALDEKYGEDVGGNYKRIVMLAFGALTALGMFGLSCAGRWSGVSCNADGAFEMLVTFGAFVMSNQVAFMAAPKVK